MATNHATPSALTVIGIDHRIQSSLCTGPAADLAARYEKDLRRLVGKSGPVLICEETKHQDEKSIAHKVADSFGHQYRNVDMTRNERERRGIPFDYAGYPKEMSKYSPLQIKQWQIEREAFMLDEILDAISSGSPNRPVHLFVICGACHIGALCAALSQQFSTAQVASIDLSKSFGSR